MNTWALDSSFDEEYINMCKWIVHTLFLEHKISDNNLHICSIYP